MSAIAAFFSSLQLYCQRRVLTIFILGFSGGLPLMLVFYRNEPGIDFLATLVGIAVVRTLLIGPVEDFQLYNIDFLFGAAILLVGTVSLIKAMRANSRREMALRSGETSSW